MLQVVDQGNGHTIHLKLGHSHPLQILSSVPIFPVCQKKSCQVTLVYEAFLGSSPSSEVTWVPADPPCVPAHNHADSPLFIIDFILSLSSTEQSCSQFLIFPNMSVFIFTRDQCFNQCKLFRTKGNFCLKFYLPLRCF